MANTRNNDYSKQENCGGMNQKSSMEKSREILPGIRSGTARRIHPGITSETVRRTKNRTAIAMQMKNTVIKRQNPGRQDDALYIYTEERRSCIYGKSGVPAYTENRVPAYTEERGS